MDWFDPTKLAVHGEEAHGKPPSSPDWHPTNSNIPAAPWGDHFRNILKSGDVPSNWGRRPDL